ncbi:MAG TPA: hypothetical protein VNO50_03375 [Pyrinomonadaceae bacterium]|nr:hypothetical protein [Pyrinomonadaceae bacterium]
MKSPIRESKRMSAILLSIIFLVCASATVDAQTRAVEGTIFQMGQQRITIPAPDGFEEASSQFKSIKDRFTVTEATGNEVLAVHLPKSDCDKLRSGVAIDLNFYTKISVRESVRASDLSPPQFARLISEFRGASSKIMDINSPETKTNLARMNRNLSELNQQEVKIDLSQPVNLGEFDTRPNIYSVMLLVNLKSKTADGDVVKVIVGSLSYVRVKQRLIYVYTYREYKSTNDIEVLRDFTKQWIGQILAAN